MTFTERFMLGWLTNHESLDVKVKAAVRTVEKLKNNEEEFSNELIEVDTVVNKNLELFNSNILTEKLRNIVEDDEHLKDQIRQINLESGLVEKEADGVFVLGKVRLNCKISSKNGLIIGTLIKLDGVIKLISKKATGKVINQTVIYETLFDNLLQSFVIRKDAMDMLVHRCRKNGYNKTTLILRAR